MSIPQTNIRKETGGYRPISKVIAQAHFHPARVKFVAGGVRGSKSQSMAAEFIAWMMHSDLQWLVGQNYNDCRQEFEYIAEAALSLGWTNQRLLTFPQNIYQPCALETIWGTLLETKSAADEATLMSRAPDIIGFCEPGKMSLTAYRRAKERLSTRRGELYMGGTFENNAPWMEAMYHKWKRWPNEDNAKAFTSPTYSNRIIFPSGIRDSEYQALRNDILYAQDAITGETAGVDEYFRRLIGVPAAAPEIIFSKHFKKRDHVRALEWVRLNEKGDFMPVYGAVDPGYSGTSRYIFLAIQIIGKEIRIIDEVVARGLTHTQMKFLVAKKPWWPHVHTGTIDPYAGDSHVYGANQTPAEAWRADEAPGRVNLQAPERLKNTEEEIRMAYNYFSGLNGWKIVISDRCERLIWELTSWKRKKTNNIIGDPLKMGNDAIKALIYFLTHHSNGLVEPRARQQIEVVGYNLVGAGVQLAMDIEAQNLADRDDQYTWGSEKAGWL